MQEICTWDRPYLPIYVLEDFVSFKKRDGLHQDPINEYWKIFQSMEQLWLGHVMKELYLKIWNGVKWKEMGEEE